MKHSIEAQLRGEGVGLCMTERKTKDCTRSWTVLKDYFHFCLLLRTLTGVMPVFLVNYGLSHTRRVALKMLGTFSKKKVIRLVIFDDLFLISVEPSSQAVTRFTKRKFVEKREGEAYVVFSETKGSVK